MFKKAVLLVVLLSVASLQAARAQSDERKFEVGGQFSLMRLPSQTEVGIGVIDCFPAPCPNPIRLEFAQRRKTEPGGGGRFGYNFSRHVALEAEGNFFPRDRDAEGGRKIQVLAGVKTGKRFDKFGLFAKARPGFMRFSKGDYQQFGSCILLFPPPAACFQPVSKTSFAFDLGGVAEWYPSKNSIVRFDAGDTIIRFGRRNVTAIDISPAGFRRVVVVSAPAETKHNFQASLGIGYRF
jgi:hypothetical protein